MVETTDERDSKHPGTYYDYNRPRSAKDITAVPATTK
jgi:hypothetical protein